MMCLLLSRASKVALAASIGRAEARPQITRYSVEHVHGAKAEELPSWLAFIRCIVGVYLGRDFALARPVVSDHWSENQDSFFPALNEAAKRVPCTKSGDVGSVGLLQSTHTMPMF
jgi:hypothetical protein